MSLDVYLRKDGAKQFGEDRFGVIFVRENGELKEITRAEWDTQHPDREPVTIDLIDRDEYLFQANITHNLNTMAGEAGIYDCLWRPDEIGITKARQLVEPLRVGLALMKSDPPRFEKHNPSNGWGSYERFIPWIERYLVACEEYPNATVEVSR